MKHIAIYVRVSSRTQDTASQDVDLARWVAAMAADRECRWYRDTATGKNMDRPGWRDLEAALLQKQVAYIVVWRLDRLGRTASGLTKLFDSLGQMQVNLVSLKDSLDLSTPAGRLMANVLASVAQYETEVRSERQRAGIDAAKAAGKKWGGGKPGRRISAEAVRTILDLEARGVPRAQIARAVGVGRATVYAVLAQEAAVVPQSTVASAMPRNSSTFS